MLSTGRRIDGNRYDAVVVGAGHNGLVAAAYLGRAGLKVALLESREVLGGPVGTFEFMPGYKTAFSNSPGSFEPRIIQELELERHGLRFRRMDPTLVHHFPERPFISWRDRSRTDEQLNRLSPGEADRFHDLVQELEDLAVALNFSLFRPDRNLQIARKNLSPDHRRLFDEVFTGSLQSFLDARLKTTQAKALLGMVALNVTMAPPSQPGTAVGLMLRPISKVSSAEAGADDPRRIPLRGSTGLPIGGMGAIVDSLESCCKELDVDVRPNATVIKILHKDGAVSGVVLAQGEEINAPIVISAINPQTAFGLLDGGAVPESMQEEIAALPMTGSAFKLVLALDRIPKYVGLPDDLDNETAASTQFRIGSSLGHIEEVIQSAQSGEIPTHPLIWGLIPSLTTPELAPEGKHLLSANVWHAPYAPNSGSWENSQDWFRDRCIDAISDLMPNLKDCIIDCCVMSPPALEKELRLVRSHITHGDMLPDRLFGPRPHTLADDYRTPLSGFYLSGSGTWPGGYVTGIPGLNTSQTVLQDLRDVGCSTRGKERWSSW